MIRFAEMLKVAFQRAGHSCEIWNPTVFLGKLFPEKYGGLGKWLGYIDKWILFPVILRLKMRSKHLKKKVHFQIADHSNSPYLRWLPRDRTGITCHDVLAIRGALGHADAHCPSSRAGKILQKWILKSLKKAKFLASVSQETLNQLTELIHNTSREDRNWAVIHNSFNADFYIMDEPTRDEILERCGLNIAQPFLLHVGSSLPRKNRDLLLEMAAILGKEWPGYICFAGDAPDEMLLKKAEKLQVKHKLKFIVKPAHSILLALYNGCDAFIFPSFSEGFGWPVIEAQACGAPVIASENKPLCEVSGGAAYHADPSNPKEFVSAYRQMQKGDNRQELIKAGLKNIERFSESRMAEKYLELHGFRKKVELVS